MPVQEHRPSTRIAVAMSGGVDSSVAAALLAAEGADVIGLSMQLYDQRSGEQTFGSCCTLDDLYDARRVAASLGFPHYILNLEAQFTETVVRNFVTEYAAGRTPIPCTHCNSELKFQTLLERAEGFGAESVATGHYARVERTDDGAFHLRRSVDTDKDQSYFLFGLTQAQLARTRFPLGGMRKPEVRALARQLGLRVAAKPDSQEICFVPSGDHAAFVARHAPQVISPGEIRDQQGTVLGRHDGVQHFTVGQRKGLRLSSSVPLYVLKIDAAEALVTVGPRSALDERLLRASRVNWIAGTPPADARVSAQIRHRHLAQPGRLTITGPSSVCFEFDEPQPAISPGQAVVFYDDDLVLGGGWID